LTRIGRKIGALSRDSNPKISLAVIELTRVRVNYFQRYWPSNSVFAVALCDLCFKFEEHWTKTDVAIVDMRKIM